MTAQQVLEIGLKLTPKEREEVAHGLYDSINGVDNDDDDDDELEITPEMIAELDRVAAEADQFPERGVSWEDVQKRWNKEIGE